MEFQRWRIKELSPADLIVDRPLINLPPSSPKSPSVEEFYNEFKTKSLKSRRIILYRYNVPPVRNKKITKCERPRFTNKIPSSFIKPYQLRQCKTNSPKGRNPQKELLIENLIKNREDLYLPALQSTSSKYCSLKEKLENTKTGFFSKLSSLTNNLESLDIEKVHWHNEPIRKWETRNQSSSPNSKKKSQKKSESALSKAINSTSNHPNIIESIISSCEYDIKNWPSP